DGGRGCVRLGREEGRLPEQVAEAAAEAEPGQQVLERHAEPGPAGDHVCEQATHEAAQEGAEEGGAALGRAQRRAQQIRERAAAASRANSPLGPATRAAAT